MSKLPTRKVSESAMRDLIPAGDVEPIPVQLERTLTDPSGAYTYAILSAGGKSVAHVLNSGDATTLNYVSSGLSKTAHIPTDHQMFIGLLKEVGLKLKSATIEGKTGDIFYARLAWEFPVKEGKGTPPMRYTPCTVGCALVCAVLEEADIFIIKRVLDEMDAADSWPYQDEMEDYGDH